MSAKSRYKRFAERLRPEAGRVRSKTGMCTVPAAIECPIHRNGSDILVSALHGNPCAAWIRAAKIGEENRFFCEIIIDNSILSTFFQVIACILS